MENLKPCPSCGGEVFVSLRGKGTINWFVISGSCYSKQKRGCDCNFEMESERYFIDCKNSKEVKERAWSNLIKAWNTRADDPITIKPIQIQLTKEQMEELIEAHKRQIRSIGVEP